MKPIILDNFSINHLRVFAPSEKRTQQIELPVILENICIFQAIVNIPVKALKHQRSSIQRLYLFKVSF